MSFWGFVWRGLEMRFVREKGREIYEDKRRKKGWFEE